MIKHANPVRATRVLCSLWHRRSEQAWCLHGPSFERGDGEEWQHGLADVVKVELAVAPLAHAQSRRVIHKHQVLASTHAAQSTHVNM